VIVYKIRNKTNPELFLIGTPTYNSWDKSGRIFQTLGKLRSFLTNTLKHEHKTKNIGVWEVVELELVELSAKDVHEMIKPEQLVKMLTK
jgi:hypothetical protein